MKQISNIALTLFILAISVWISAYLYWALLSSFSLRVSRRIKENYLKAILR
jgi:hypothetical protein